MTKRKLEHNWVKRKCKAWPGHHYTCSNCILTLFDFHWEYSHGGVRLKCEGDKYA